MRCAECGRETAEESQYCALCGAPVSQQRSMAAAPSPGGPGDAIATDQRTPLADQEAAQDALSGGRAGQRHRRRGPLMMVGVALAVLVAVIVAITIANSSSGRQLTVDQLRPGDCLPGSNMGLGTGRPWPDLVTAVPCTQRHLAEVFFAGNVWPQTVTAYPGDNSVYYQALARCADAFAEDPDAI